MNLQTPNLIKDQQRWRPTIRVHLPLESTSKSTAP
jgi:hypothetical protein